MAPATRGSPAVERTRAAVVVVLVGEPGVDHRSLRRVQKRRTGRWPLPQLRGVTQKTRLGATTTHSILPGHPAGVTTDHHVRLAPKPPPTSFTPPIYPDR